MYLQEHLIPITLGGEISRLSPLTVFLFTQWNFESISDESKLGDVLQDCI